VYSPSSRAGKRRKNSSQDATSIQWNPLPASPQKTDITDSISDYPPSVYSYAADGSRHGSAHGSVNGSTRIKSDGSPQSTRSDLKVDAEYEARTEAELFGSSYQTANHFNLAGGNITATVTPEAGAWRRNSAHSAPASSSYKEFAQFDPYGLGLAGPLLDTTTQRNISSGCTCLSSCLQALHTLCQHSANQVADPPFDIILTLNREAMECCNTVLNCMSCLFKAGINTSIMLLATLIGKIVTFYRLAAQSNFNTPGEPMRLMLGTYRVKGEDEQRLKSEILLMELRKVDNIFARFKIVCRSVPDAEMGVCSVLTSYLAQNLQLTFDYMQKPQLVAM
jgi:hypothetical protein